MTTPSPLPVQPSSTPSTGPAVEHASQAMITRWQRWKWPLIVVAMLMGHVGLVLAGVFITGSDPSFSVERDYYNKALEWDRSQMRVRDSESLGWTVSLQVGDVLEDGRRPLALALKDANAKPIEHAQIEALTFAHARANKSCKAVFTPAAMAGVALPAGNFVALVDPMPAGLWELRITAVAGDQTFHTLQRIYVDVANADSAATDAGARR